LAQKDVDPAALLIAVLVAVTTQVLTPGPWSVSDTIVAIIVLMIVIAYSPPIMSQENASRRFTAFLVIDLIWAAAISWPVQYLIVRPFFGSGNDDMDADLATGTGFLIVLIVSILWLRLRNHERILALTDRIQQPIGRAINRLVPRVDKSDSLKEQEKA
jgi:uncharacterized membrane protein